MVELAQQSDDLLALDGNLQELPRQEEGRSRILVVLPAFNEEQNLGPLLEKIDCHLREANLPFHIIVVDDGSTDKTPSVVQSFKQRMRVTSLRHPINLGLGRTIGDGLRFAMNFATDEDVVISMDADETHPPGLIPRMFRSVREGHDVVIASRYRQGSRVFGLSVRRRLISAIASIVTRFMFPTCGVRDFTCGFRAYSGKALRLAFREYGNSLVDQAGFQCMMDILLKMRRLPLVFGEVPMVLRYDFKKGPSKLPAAETISSTILLLLIRRLGIMGKTSARAHQRVGLARVP